MLARVVRIALPGLARRPLPRASSGFSNDFGSLESVKGTLRESARQRLKAIERASQAKKTISDAAATTAAQALESALGEGASDALKSVIGSTGDRFKDLVSEGRRHAIAINLAMICRQVKDTNRYTKPLSTGVPYTDREVIEKAARYSLYANAVYEKTEDDVVSMIPGLTRECIRHMELGESVKSPTFLIVEEPIMNTIVIAIRGTASVADAFTNCLCDEVPFLGGQAHGGILENARKVVDISKPIVEKLLREAPPDAPRRVVLTGHSLGAGTAVLTTFTLFSKESEDCIHDPSLAECYAFAAPPVFFPRAKLPSPPLVYSFVHNMDCIPRTCLGTGVKLMMAVKRVDEMAMSTSQRVTLLGSSSFPAEPFLPDYEEIPDNLLQKYRCHEPAGRLILIRGPESGVTICEEMQPEMTDRLLLHPRMMVDHYMKHYCELLDNLFKCTVLSGSAPYRLPLHLEQLPREELQAVVAALSVLQEAGLTRVLDVETLRSHCLGKLVGKDG